MTDKTCSSLTAYWSHTGNTKQVAETIHSTLEGSGITSTIAEINSKLEFDFFDYNLIFVAAPVYSNLPPPVVSKFLNRSRNKSGNVVAAAPERPGHFAVPVCTYGGGHTGIREAIPALKYMGQFLEHIGIRVVDEWAVVGIFRGVDDDKYNSDGRIGDIRHRPDERDLEEVRGKVTGLLHRLQFKLPGLGPD